MRTLATRARAINQYNGLGNQLWDLAGNRPSLDLRFAESKSLVDATTGTNLVDFTRASSGTYVGSDGLIKTATTNLIWPSEDFTAWGLAAATRVADAGIAPNGTLTADRIESTGGGVFKGGVSVVSGVPYTYSVYIKHVSGTGVLSSIGFERFGSVLLAGQTSFNVLTGTVVSNGAAVTDSSITPAGDGWYRVSVRATSTDTTATIINYASASGNKFLLWGAQLEQSSTVGEYIKTTSTINSAPRFDHDPETGECLGLLVEEQRQNLLLQSEDFSTTWTVSNYILASSFQSPAGTLTATKAVRDTNLTSASSISQNVSIASSTSYTFSCYLKAGELSKAALREGVSTGAYISVDLSAGSLIDQNQIGSDYSITPAGGGWYRVSFTITSTVSQTSFGCRIYALPDSYTSGSPVFSWAGDGTSGIYTWGAQLEEGSFPTSYIPTVGAGVITPGYTTPAVTRAADVASISGSNFSSWYRQDEGTMFAEAFNRQTYDGTNSFPYILQFDDGSNAERISFDHSVLSGGYRAQFIVRDNNVNTASITAKAGIATGLVSMSAAYGLDSFAASANGGSAVTDPPGPIPTVDRLQIGLGFGSQYNGTIRRLTYWQTRLPDSTLQGITQE